MLQRARSQASRSFLRELEFALVAISDEKPREYFLSALQEIDSKRKSPQITKTGEKDIKSEILAYLNQKGYTQTANIWARALSIDRKDINNLLHILQSRLLAQGIEGICEVHLQDREINSPHIQFVGIRADEAESIIAHTLVELGYESSVENALSKKDFRPYFKINAKAPHPKHNDIDKQIAYHRSIRQKQISDDEIDKLLEAFENRLESLRLKTQQMRALQTKRTKEPKSDGLGSSSADSRKTDSQLSFEQRLVQYSQNKSQSLRDFKQKRKEYRMRRLRRRR